MGGGIRVYISGNSGNKEIVTHQQRIFMILKSLAIEFEPVDIAAPGMEKQKEIMRSKGKKKEGQRNVLPPQIFNADKYCGDYDDFDLANEDDELEEFLGIPRKTPKSNPVNSSKGPVDVSEQNGHAETNGDSHPAGDASEAAEPPPTENGEAPPTENGVDSAPPAESSPAEAAPTTEDSGGGKEKEAEGEEEEEEEEDGEEEYEYEEGEEEA